MKTREKIKKNEDQRKALLSRLFDMENILSGSHNTVYRKCGKITCWCNKAPKGHAYSRYIWRDKQTGATKTNATHENEVAWIKECIANYREVKKAILGLESLNSALLLEVRKMIEHKIEKTEKIRVLAATNCKKSAK